jgi:hypothetical protein
MNATQKMQPMPARTNGLDMTALFATLEAVKNDPLLGRFEFRARNRWIDGG